MNPKASGDFALLRITDLGLTSREVRKVPILLQKPQPLAYGKVEMGLQMSVTEYASYDAVGLAELVRKREVSPTELVEAAIERIEKHRMRQPFPKLRLCPILKASCSSLRPARARPAVRRRGPPLRPLRPRPLRLHQDLGAASCCP